MDRGDSSFEGIVAVFEDGADGDGGKPTKVLVSMAYASGKLPWKAHGWYLAASTCPDATYLDCYDAAPHIRYKARCIGGAFIHDDLPPPLCTGGSFVQDPVLVSFSQPQLWLEVPGFPLSLHIGCGAYNGPYGNCGGHDALPITGISISY